MFLIIVRRSKSKRKLLSVIDVQTYPVQTFEKSYLLTEKKMWSSGKEKLSLETKYCNCSQHQHIMHFVQRKNMIDMEFDF